MISLVLEILTNPAYGHGRVPACELPKSLPACPLYGTSGAVMIRSAFQDAKVYLTEVVNGILWDC